MSDIARISAASSCPLPSASSGDSAACSSAESDARRIVVSPPPGAAGGAGGAAGAPARCSSARDTSAAAASAAPADTAATAASRCHREDIARAGGRSRDSTLQATTTNPAPPPSPEHDTIRRAVRFAAGCSARSLVRAVGRRNALLSQPLATLGFVHSAKLAPSAPRPGGSVERSSASDPSRCRIESIAFDIVVDFAASKLACSADYSVRVVAAGASELVLDTKDLDVTAVSVDGSSVPVALDVPVEPFGRALRVPLPDGLPAGARVAVSIAWSTTPASSSLQWLTPAQTSGAHPYVMSQNQAIHARAMFPAQDTPGVKFTYSARVTAPAPLTALMSAQRAGGGEPEPAAGGARVFSFAQRVPVPSYLVSIAVGHLDSRAVGARTRVWAEPAVLDAAAAEFGDCLERFVAAGEALVGPYVWGTYEVLVCPKSFAYGGMEHPVVTNVTPTLLAGDGSLVDVVAHEAAHSWTGNSVGCATWESFFLNEGFTMMLERKICAAVGSPGDYDFSALSGAYALDESVRAYTERGEERFTALVPDLAGVDPDDAFSAVPYERGFGLLHAIQRRVGAAAFNAFLHDWVQTFKFKAVTTDDFRAYANAYFAEGRFALPRVAHAGRPEHTGARGAPTPEDIAALAGEPVVAVPPAGVPADVAAAAAAGGVDLEGALDWDAWLYATGPPPEAGGFDAAPRRAVEAAADAWLAAGGRPAAAAAARGPAAFADWPSSRWVAFLERVAAASVAAAAAAPPATLPPRLLAELDADYALSASRNAEIRLLWCAVRLRSGDAGAVEPTAAFLREQGRMKYVRPLFRELLRTPFGRPRAVALFEEVRDIYHPVAAKMVAADMAIELGRPPVDFAARAHAGGGGGAGGGAGAGAGAPVPAAPVRAPSVAELFTATAMADALADEGDEGEGEDEEGGDEEEEDEDEEEEEEDGGDSAPARRRTGFGVSVASARARAVAKAVRAEARREDAAAAAAAVAVAAAVAAADEGPDVEEVGEDEDEEEEDENAVGGGKRPGGAGGAGAASSAAASASAAAAAAAGSPPARRAPPPGTPAGLSSPAASPAEAAARLAAAAARRDALLAASPLKSLPPTADADARDAAVRAAKRAAAAAELVAEDDLDGPGLGLLGAAVAEALEGVRVPREVGDALSSAAALVAVALAAAGVLYAVRRARW